MKAGWEEVTLGEVCELIKRGIAPKYLDEGGIRVVNQKCVRDHHINYDLARRNNAEIKRVPDERYIQVGDVLVNSTGTGTLGRVAQIREAPDEPTTVDTHVTIVRPTQGMFYLPFFGYMLIKIEDEIAAAGQGTSGQTELPRKDLQTKFRVRFPRDLEEQRRIVAVLDTAFAKLDRARANVEANLADAIRLKGNTFETKLVERGPYQYVTLEDVCDDFEYGTSNRSEAQGQTPVLRMGNIQDGRIDWTDLKFSSDAEDLQKYNLKSGDVLFNRTNSAAHVGKTAIFSGARPAIFAGYLVRPHYRRDKVDGRFLCHYLNSPRARAYGRKVMSKSVNQANISAGKLKKYPFPMVSVALQIEITTEVDVLVGKLDQISKSLRSKLANIEALRQSLLQLAFAGELSKTTPILIQEAETNEELAAAVLIHAYDKHLVEGTQKTFGRVKAQKVLSLAESVGRIDVGRNPIKQAAGPHDEAHMRRVQDWAEEAGAFRFEERKEGGYTFIRGRNYEAALEEARSLLGDRLQDLQRFLPLIVKMSSRQAEVLATVHAAWNNLLSDGGMPSDKDIVRASREDWHRKKLNIPRDMFFNAVALIRREGIEPDGSAKYVGGQESLSL